MFQPAKKTTLVPILLSVALGALAFTCSGCGEKDEKSQAQPPRPQRPAQTARNDAPDEDYDDYDDAGSGAPAMAMGLTLDDLRFEMGIDRRVSINPQEAVSDRAMAESALRFCEAYAKGDQQAFSRFLVPEDRATLEELAAEGLWQAETASINEVALLQLTPMGMGYLLKVGIAGSTVVTQDWTAQAQDDAFRFAARTGYMDYGSSMSLADLKTQYYEGGGMLTDGVEGAGGGQVDMEVLRAIAEATAAGDEESDEEEAEPYERPSMNPAHHIRKKFYPGG